MMKKWLLPLLAALLPLSLAAQERQLTDIASHLGANRVSLHYDCVFTQDAPVHLTGVLTIQAPCYRAVGNGMEIYNDGTTRWAVDRESKEVYVEEAEGLEELTAWQESLTDLKITEVKYLPLLEDLSEFRFDTAALDASWVVTDLR
jgi:hypothetical protein